MKIDKKEKAVVVIGSGPGGAQVAYQLTKQGIPVVLLEAGRRLQDFGTGAADGWHNLACRGFSLPAQIHPLPDQISDVLNTSIRRAGG